jgi:hypothetical protein
MGCDGGTIPKRDELVRKKKKPEQVSASYKTFIFNKYHPVVLLRIKNSIYFKT